MATSQKYSNYLADPSAWLLLISNLVTIYFVLTGDITLITVLWIYWFQSVIIGVFNFIRILELEDYSTEDFKINGMSVEPGLGVKMYTAFFFFFHYGMFHVVYMMFLLSDSLFSNQVGTMIGSEATAHTSSITSPSIVLIAAGAFFANHLFSYVYNRQKERGGKNIGTVMFYPYIRIIPMHLILLFGSFVSGALLPFLVLKTVADVVMHSIEHRKFRTLSTSD